MVFIKCLSEPKHFLRLTAVVVCLCFATYQVSECFRKILHPPTSTHYTFKLNESMKYPSLTLCRNPPYKTTVFEKYGMATQSPYYHNTWKSFKFNNYSLEEFFKEASYTFEELVPFYGFDGFAKNVQVEPFLKLLHGTCFKLTPKNYSLNWNKESGYLLLMKHTELSRSSNLRESLAGFHVHVHEHADMLTDKLVQDDSFMEYIYVDAGEELSYNLRVNEYSQLPHKDNKCVAEHNYSKSKCQLECLNKKVTKEAGCSTPWMENEELPRCGTYLKLKLLIQLSKTYGETSKLNEICQCERSCNITIYIPYVQSRRDAEMPNSVLGIYYTSNLIKVMKEIKGYDWNLFLSDLGGSLGFLLGVSVLGFVGAAEQILEMCIPKKKTDLIQLNNDIAAKQDTNNFSNEENQFDDYYLEKKDLNINRY